MQFTKISYILYASYFLIMSYFVFHIYNGERGLFARERLSAEINILQDKYEEIQAKRLKLEWKINNLGSGQGYVDPDLLSEYMRDLGYVRQDEILLLE
ncbi:MAG: septum formation initiator family protein [Pseudomonadota bacterium]